MDGFGAAPAVANKDEAARVVGWSLPTLTAWLKNHPQSAAVISRGDRGVGWQIDIGRLVAEIKALNEAEAEQLSQRAAMLETYRLPLELDGLTGDHGGNNVSAAEILKLSRARMQDHKLAREAGFLVQTSTMRLKGMALFTRLGKFFDTLPGLIGRQHQLPDPVVRAIKAMLDDQRRQVVRDLQAMFQGEGDEAELGPAELGNGTNG